MLSKEEYDRIRMLRDKAVEPVISYDEFYYHFFKCMSQSEDQGTFEQRYVKAYSYAFAHVTPCIDDGELIVGKCSHLLAEEKKKECEELKAYAEQLFRIVGQDSHMAIDYELVLDKGLTGIIERIEQKLEHTKDESKRSFYVTCKACLETVIAYAKSYSEYAAKLAQKEENAKRKAELEKIAEICSKVPKNPAESFYEAVQSVHFITHCISMEPNRHFVSQQYQLGHPDRYLYKFYQKDLQTGDITPEKAQVLLDCLGIQINHRVQHGLSSGYMVSGRDREGRLVANDLTTMCMQVIDDIQLVYPAVGLCYTQDMPDKYLKCACEILSHGRSHPAIFNDDIISEGLKYYGVPEEECHDYIHSTCVEITPVASSNVWVTSPYINLLQPVLDSMDREYEKMNEFRDAVLAKLDAKIAAEFECQNQARKLRSKNMCPTLSCLVHDCLEKGIDIERGGARYNWIMPSFVGMANFADSFAVIEKMVFEDKKYSMTDLKKMLDCNFAGYETQRMEFLNKVSKYGNDDDTADKWSEMIAEHIVAECKKYTPIFSNARLIPSVFCWIMHSILGEATGATPDGRTAGFPLGDGSGAAQGREKNGPTASVISSTKWSHKEFIGGVAVNLKFSKKIFDRNSFEVMIALIKTYMQRGGFEIQINVVDRQTLLAAQKNPELYKDLVVRIGGYSDYFVKLSANMQEEILLRTEHEL